MGPLENFPINTTNGFFAPMHCEQWKILMLKVENDSMLFVQDEEFFLRYLVLFPHSINRREMLEKSYSYTMRIRVSVMGGGFLLSFGSHNIV